EGLRATATPQSCGIQRSTGHKKEALRIREAPLGETPVSDSELCPRCATRLPTCSAFPAPEIGPGRPLGGLVRWALNSRLRVAIGPYPATFTDGAANHRPAIGRRW